MSSTAASGIGTPFDAVYCAIAVFAFVALSAWLKAAEKSFEFWNNPDDAVYDSL